MKKIKLILVVILVISLNRVLSQTNDISIFETKDSIAFYVNNNLYKFNGNEGIFRSHGIQEIEKYFNGIFQEFNVNIGIVSEVGYTNIKLNRDIWFKIKYGSLKLDDNFSKVKTKLGKNMNGSIFGVDFLVFLNKKNNFKLIISLGEDWIKINNSRNISRFKVNIGVKSNN